MGEALRATRSHFYIAIFRLPHRADEAPTSPLPARQLRTILFANGSPAGTLYFRTRMPGPGIPLSPGLTRGRRAGHDVFHTLAPGTRR